MTKRFIPPITIFQPNGWSNSILPIDVLHKIVNEMNNLITIINEMEDDSVERAKEYTDSQITIVNNEIAVTNSNIEQLNTSLQASIRSINYTLTVLQTQLNTYGDRLTTLDNREANHYTTINNRFTQVYRDLVDLANQLRNYTDLQILALKDTLEAEIDELRVVIDNILNVKTYDGFTGTLRTVRSILGDDIIKNAAFNGGADYRLTWGHFDITSDDGWIFSKSSRFKTYCNLIAPTWGNMMINTYQFTSGQKAVQYHQLLGTWGSFCYKGLLYITDLIHNLNRFSGSGTAAIANNFKNVDVFNITEFNAWIGGGDTKPTTISNVDITTEYESGSTYLSLIVAQFKKSIAIFTGYNNAYGLYGSNGVFNGTTDLPAILQLLAGVTNNRMYTDSWDF